MEYRSQEEWPSVSVIVPVYDDLPGIRRCLEAIKAQNYPGPWEVIVVDNSAQFGLNELSEELEGVKLISEPRPGSYNARNAGLRVASGEVLAFTDADCRPQPEWLTNGANALATDPTLAVAGGAIQVVVDHPGPPSLPELYQLALAFPQKNYIEHQDYAATANMFTRRQIFEEVGAFDGSLMSGGDLEFGRRVAAAGHRLGYVPDAVVQHPARATYGEIFRKIRRIVGGERDRRPSWSSCIAYCLRNLIPSRFRLLSIIRCHASQIGPVTKLRLMAMAITINWVYAYVRFALQLTKAASSRN